MRTLVAAFLAAASMAASAGPIQLAADINRTTSLYNGVQPLQFGSKWALPLCPQSRGCETWVTDGTQAGTRALSEMTSPLAYGAPMSFAAIGSTLYFVARAASSGQAILLRSDGTSAGTEAIASVGYPHLMVAAGSSVFFTGTDGRLWKTDGNPGAETKLSEISPSELTSFGGKLYFAGSGMPGGTELWMSDGTGPGTVEVTTINPGITGSDPIGLSVVGSLLYFWAHESDFEGRVLFATDGTAAGTRRVGDVTPIAMSKIVGFNGKAHVIAQGPHSVVGLWQSDGTPEGTVLLSSWAGSVSGTSPTLAAAGSRLYFLRNGELWRTDGTAAGTTGSVALLNPGPFVGIGNNLYIRAYAGDGYRLHKLDDATGTATLFGPEDVELVPWDALGDRLIAFANFSLVAWLTDGTDPGTQPLLVAEGQPSNHSRCSEDKAVLGAFVYFVATDGIHGCELWRSDGTAAGTSLVKDLTPGPVDGLLEYSGPTKFTVAAPFVYFVPRNGHLWRTDGTPAGTIQLTSGQFPSIHSLASLDSTAFMVMSGTTGNEVWKSDGSPEGTVLLMQIAGSFSSDAASLGTAVRMGGRLYFSMRDQFGIFLARTDGTPAGTSAFFQSPGYIETLVAAENQLFFTTTSTASGREVWRSDGTAAGTNMVIDLDPGSGSGYELMLFSALGNSLIFGGRSGSVTGLFRTDGTAAGTVHLGSVTVPRVEWGGVATVGSRLYFVVQTPANGLWALAFTDETANITILNPGPLGFNVSMGSFIGTPSTLFFTAGTSAAGEELWMSHGTSAGTVMVEDHVPGPGHVYGSYSDMKLRAVVLPTGIFFYAESRVAGYELHFVAFDTTPSPLSFPTRNNVTPDSDVISDPVQVTGVNVPAPVSSSGGQFCVSSANNCACDLAPFATSGSVQFNQYLCVKHRSAPTLNTSTVTSLDVGGVGATFTSNTPAAHALSVTIGGSGSVVSSIPGIACPGDCSESFVSGTNVTLYASAAPGSTFTGWTGGGCSGTGVCTVNVSGATSVAANFAAGVLEVPVRDFSGDGRSDLVWRHTNGTYGAWTMNGLSASGFGGVSAGAGAVIKQIADFDGNGRYDIVWRRADGSYQLDLMNGLGVSGSATILGAGTGWELVHSGDFNDDGKADLVWKGPTGTIGIWLMDGLAFTSAGAAAHPGVGYDVIQVADFDGDGKSDLLWRHTDGRIRIAIMDGLASTGGALLLGVANGWTPTHVGDLDGDGKMDLAWRHTDGSVGLWLMNGLTIKQYASVMGAGTGWSVAAMGDLDGDGRADLVWAHTNGMQAAWLMNGVSAQEFAIFQAAGSGWSVAATGDYDGDGKDDIVWKHTDGTHRLWLMHGLAVKGSTTLVGPGSAWSAQP